MIKTNRLLLRKWQESDLAPFAALNADPKVMEYFPSPKSLEETKKEYERILGHFKKYGFGLFVVTLLENQQFIGFIGLAHVNFSAPFTPAVEIGWRLAHEFWGKGYATEGAKACLEYGFNTLLLKEIVSFTSTLNKRSIHVMEKIGMTHDLNDDFDHPNLSKDSPLKRHVLYRKKI